MVIQRWQSLMLFMAALLMGFFTFMSLGQVQLPDLTTLNFTTFGFQYEGTQPTGAADPYYMQTWGFFVISLLTCILPFINIFLFKNTRLQKMVCLIELLLLVAVIVVGAIYGYNGIDNAAVSWSTIICAPFLALIITVMAFNRISADERLLRSAERFR
ncbi:MAG: DUF4293 domain-containing protein [Muribaculaceae bacterium]|nr:DUF4293 domain-containing protein [Muribaculaceae bacterium]